MALQTRSVSTFQVWHFALANVIQQDLFQQIAESGGKATENYHQALNYIRHKCRTEGIDAALQDRKTGENFDALILFDRKGAGQQLAAQAGKDFQ